MPHPKFSKKALQIMFAGLDNAGKSTIIKHASGDSSLAVCKPTVGCDSREFFYAVPGAQYCCRQRFYHFELIDLGGYANIRDIWQEYYATSVGICFVLDASDIGRFGEVKDVLDDVLNHQKAAGIPILIIANKQDLNCKIKDIFDFYEFFKTKLDLGNSVKFTVATAIQMRCENESLMEDLGWLFYKCMSDSEVINRANAKISYLTTPYDALTTEQKFKYLDYLKKRNDEIDRYNEAKQKPKSIYLADCEIQRDDSNKDLW